MSYSPVPVESFGGLNLADDPGTVGWGGAVDLCDVDFDLDGRLRSRDFFGALVANTTQTAPTIIPWPGLEGFVTSVTASVNLYSNDGSATGTGIVAPAVFTSGQPFGTASASYLYLPSGLGATVRRLTSAGVLSAPAGMPKCYYLGHTQWDNRLVAANVTTVPTGASSTASSSLLHFSAAGDGETWGANDWVQLDPGDGEAIRATAEWGNQLFVFKKSKFYVFYGTSTDSSGNPIFNYRRVGYGIGINDSNGDPVASAAVSGKEGVYFIATTGIYLTTGGDPVKISGALEPIFQNRYPAFFPPGRVSAASLRYINGRLYCLTSFYTSGNVFSQYVLVYDPPRDRWTLLSVPSTITSFGFTRNGNGGIDTPIFTVTGANSPVYQFSSAYNADATGGGPTCRYRSGFSDLGSTQRKRVREWILEGSGTPTLKTSVDFGSLETGAAVTLGTSPAVAEGRRRYATRGRQFSWQVSATGAFSLNNLVAHVDERRAPGTHA